MLAARKQRKMIIPVQVEYAVVAAPTMRRMIPTATTMKVMARLAFSVMLIASLCGIPYTIYTGLVKGSGKYKACLTVTFPYLG